MNYCVIENQIVHLTHNDSDALGCALVVDMYRKHILKKNRYACGIIPVHNFMPVVSVKENLDFLTNFLDSIYTSEETGFTLDDVDIERFEYIMSGFKYNPLGIMAIPGEIIITDLAIESSVLDKLDDVAKKFNIKLLYVDHHTSNLHNHQRYPWCYVISEDDKGKPRSACKYLLDIFKDRGIDPQVVLDNYDFFKSYINDISRYDTWLWKTDEKPIPDENHTTIIIDMVGGVYNAYKMLRKLIIADQYIVTSFRELPGIDTLISADESKRMSQIKFYSKKAVYTMGYNLNYNTPEYATLTFALIVLPESYSNDIMTDIYMNTDKNVDIVIGLFPNARTLSFRKSPKCHVDLSVFASKYGGGGHKDAAGAKLDTDAFLNILNKYYVLFDEKNAK
jgi:oligoribonuclease NrnB/cAMP/cGMP phosphodiesterase (DHH superfamily)